MTLKIKILILYFFLGSFLSTANNAEEVIGTDEHIEVSMRMIGHGVLLMSGDTISRVLPVEKRNNQYIIQFESDFQFEPESLASTVDRLIEETNIATHYIVEVQTCETGEVIYSYEMEIEQGDSIIPCRGRVQPVGCYSIAITILASPPPSEGNATQTSDSPTQKSSATTIVSLVVLILFIIGFLILRLKKKKKPANSSHLIELGSYQFDTKNMALINDKEKTELTSKESDLLSLLYDRVNSTVERVVILNEVWGDQGDYVGRTLDVYISKLRKKLENDESVKIINIRGIGYKLVLND